MGIIKDYLLGFLNETSDEAIEAKAEWERRVQGGVAPSDNGRTKVQLWEGGPYWADTNIGAEKPWEYGCYFWWGDTIGYRLEGIAWVDCDGSKFSFTDRPTDGKSIDVLKREGWITENGVLAPEHDAAHILWGGKWRMPTNQEFEDLCNKCDWTWATMNGVQGYVISGPGYYTTSRIFLPAAGFGYGTSFCEEHGHYWSSVPHSEIVNSCYLGFGEDYYGVDGCLYSRDCGMSVRPVQGFS